MITHPTQTRPTTLDFQGYYVPAKRAVLVLLLYPAVQYCNGTVWLALCLVVVNPSNRFI